MGPIDHLGITREELVDRLAQGTWERWTAAEPALGTITSFDVLRHMRGAEADALLGALVRLAAANTGNDELAACAVAHQLGAEVRRIAFSLRDLSPDIDALVMSALWIEIRTFPEQRARAYATSLLRATRQAVLNQLLPERGELRRTVLLPPMDLASESFVPVTATPAVETEDARMELLEYLTWCVATDRISDESRELLLDLVVAARNTAGMGLLNLKRGVCSLHAVRVVADERGVSIKTILRKRDTVLSQLRAARSDYLRSVA